MHEIADPIACIDCPLQDCPGLRPLEEHQLAFMQGFKEGEVALARGELLISEGQSHQQLYTLLGGVLIRWRLLDDGRRQIVNFMFPGDLVGLQSAFDEPAAHAVEALVDARLCRFPRAVASPNSSPATRGWATISPGWQRKRKPRWRGTSFRSASAARANGWPISQSG